MLNTEELVTVRWNQVDGITADVELVRVIAAFGTRPVSFGAPAFSKAWIIMTIRGGYRVTSVN